jgi:hypothetical protein
MVKIYRYIYFKLLKLSVKSQLNYWSNRGEKKVFFYERKKTPCGYSLLRFIRDENVINVGGIKPFFVIRGLIVKKLNNINLTIYTGNINSVCLEEFSNIIEIQHGLLDDSYINGKAPVLFLARSIKSAEIYQIFRPEVPVKVVSNDLTPPSLDLSELSSFDNAHFYSKNPGGGVSRSELFNIELTLTKLVPLLRLHIHPRDGFLKFLIRSRLKIIVVKAYLRSLFPVDKNKPKLVISSYSTSLYDRVNCGDFVLNLKLLNPPTKIQQLVYGHIPAYSINELELKIKSGLKSAKIK